MRAVLRAALVAGVGLVTVLAGVVLPAAPSRADAGDLLVEISDVSPAVLRPGDDLRVTGTVTNTGDIEVEAPSVRLRLQQNVPASRDALEAWLTGVSDLNVAVLGITALEDPLAPGQTAPFALELPDGQTGFDEGATWGPRGIELAASSGLSTGTSRTTLIWYPSQSPVLSPSELSVLVPLTPTPTEWRTAVAEDVPVGQVAAPRLLQVLDAVGGATSLAVDPVLIEGTGGTEGTPDGGATPDPTDPDASPTEGDGATPSDEPSGSAATDAPTGDATDDPTDDPAGTDPTAADGATDPGEGDTGTGEDPADPGGDPAAVEGHIALVERLAAGSAVADVIALPYGDADVNALAGHDATDLWQAGRERGALLLEGAGIEVLPGVEWPPGTMTDEALQMLAASGTQAVVVEGEEVAADEATDARAVIDSAGGSLDALVADADLGEALLDRGSPIAARQRTLALAAIMTRSVTDASTGFLAVLPRDVDAPGLDALDERLTSLSEAPWMQPVNLRSLLGRTDPGAVRLDLAQTPPADGALDGSAVRSLQAAATRIEAFEVATDGALAASYTSDVLSPLSATLSAVPDVREVLMTTAQAGADELGTAIVVESGSTFNLISEAGAIPVTIRNDLPVPATVQVALQPDDTRLRVEAAEQVELPPGGTSTVRVPVSAQVASGNVSVEVHVRAEPAGEDLAAPADFDVRLRADWESTGTAIVAGLLAVAFVVGLVRTIRRGGRRRGGARAVQP